MTWWLRAYLGFAAVQGFGIGLTGLLVPAEMQIPLRVSPLNARFVGALYVAGAVGVLWAAFARRREETRLFVLGFGLATGMILILTIVHWPEFMADSAAAPPGVDLRLRRRSVAGADHRARGRLVAATPGRAACPDATAARPGRGVRRPRAGPAARPGRGRGRLAVGPAAAARPTVRVLLHRLRGRRRVGVPRNGAAPNQSLRSRFADTDAARPDRVVRPP